LVNRLNPLNDYIFKRLMEEYLSSDADTVALYRAREATLHERANMINSAKEEGREEGKSEGKIEGKLETAKNFLLMGMEVEIVAKGTGLPVEKIIELRKSLIN
jgi:predicted transposase/invertase (TIGR01784 family)